MPDVVGQADVLLGPLDVLADDGRVGRLVFERGAEAGEFDAASPRTACRISSRWRFVRLASTLWACVVRSSTPS